MFVTFKPDGKVVAYSDKERNKLDLLPDETQKEVDMKFTHVATQEGKLKFVDGVLMNGEEQIAEEVKAELIPNEE